jgi:hypothetical protein
MFVEERLGKFEVTRDSVRWLDFGHLEPLQFISLTVVRR